MSHDLPILLYIAVLGAWVMYEDLRYGKIRNRLVLVSLVVGLMWNFWLAGSAHFLGGNAFIPEGAALAYLGAVALDVSISFLLAFILWIFRFWAAGDAKLFTVLTLLVPLRYYRHNMLDYFPSFVLFFNTFLVFFVLLLLEFSAKLIRRFWVERQWRQAGKLGGWFKTKVIARPLPIIRMIVGLIMLFLIIKWIRFFVQRWIWAEFHLNKTLIFLLLFLMMEPLRNVFRKPLVFGLTLLGLSGTVAYWAWHGQTENIINLVSLGAFMIFLILFKEIYEFYTDRFDVRLVTPVELHAGMIVSDKQLSLYTNNSNFNNERFGTMEADGLTPEQVEILQTWLLRQGAEGDQAEGGGDGEGAQPSEDAEAALTIEICNTVPFTPGIVLGTLATVIFAGYIIVI